VETRGHIFIRPKVSNQLLKDFAFELFRWLHIPRFDERVINPKEPETFYAGCGAGIEVSVGEHGIRGLEAFPFSVDLAPEGSKQAADYLREHAHILAWRLSRDGFRCFVPKRIAPIMSEAEGMIYDA